MAEPGKAVFRIVINGTMEAVFRELTKTGEPQGAVFNAVLTLDRPGLVRALAPLAATTRHCRRTACG